MAILHSYAVTGPYSNCKGGITQDGRDCFDHDHWLEVRTNLERYLSEDICVPGANSTETVPSAFMAALTAYLDTLNRARSNSEEGLDVAAVNMVDVHEATSKILQLSLTIVKTRSFEESELISNALPTVNEDDRCMSIARVLAVSAARAMHELVESISQDSAFYTYHHHAILLDISLEMTRLLNESLNMRSEQFLEADHPHAVAAREFDEQWPQAAE